MKSWRMWMLFVVALLGVELWIPFDVSAFVLGTTNDSAILRVIQTSNSFKIMSTRWIRAFLHANLPAMNDEAVDAGKQLLQVPMHSATVLMIILAHFFQSSIPMFADVQTSFGLVWPVWWPRGRHEHRASLRDLCRQPRVVSTCASEKKWAFVLRRQVGTQKVSLHIFTFFLSKSKVQKQKVVKVDSNKNLVRSLDTSNLQLASYLCIFHFICLTPTVEIFYFEQNAGR